MTVEERLKEIEERANAKVEACECGDRSPYNRVRLGAHGDGYFCKPCGRSHPDPREMALRDVPRLVAALRVMTDVLISAPATYAWKAGVMDHIASILDGGKGE